ncbi:MAG TPA: tetratricopeptide repeat protein, partial [Candidatus Obscuribacter sp.]|nr:tetratricopeptide repeat protein [Candidatus Obscuribacter sp.]
MHKKTRRRCKSYTPIFTLCLSLLLTGASAKAEDRAGQISALKNKSMLMANTKKFKEAIALSEQALKLDKDDATIYFLRARIREEQKDPVAALKELNKAIELNPKYAEAYLMRARAFYFLAEMDEGTDNTLRARNDLEMALKLNPRLAEAYDYKGVGLASDNKLKEALVCFSKAVELDKTNTGFLNHRAMVLNAMGKKMEATNDLRRAAEFEKNDPHGWMTLSQQLADVGIYQEAVTAINK